MDDLESAAWFIAENAHLNWMYRNEPYINHVKRVYRRVVKNVTSLDVLRDAKIVAILHDVVEDSDVSLEEIEEVFGKRIRNAVQHISRNEGEVYSDYISRVGENSISKIVKVCDILENLSQCDRVENKKLVERYEKSLVQLASR